MASLFPTGGTTVIIRSPTAAAAKGLFFINNDDWALNVTLNTGLPKGTYCDVISGDKSGGSCTGKEVLVDADGRATFSISNTDEDPFIAIHADSKL
ncbi:hypothetical protein cypCar_00040158 [Cyprinus carpio]|nr:hypothetical protein cypCar_00040158 [Cyprinus carpio]